VDNAPTGILALRRLFCLSPRIPAMRLIIFAILPMRQFGAIEHSRNFGSRWENGREQPPCRLFGNDFLCRRRLDRIYGIASAQKISVHYHHVRSASHENGGGVGYLGHEDRFD